MTGETGRTVAGNAEEAAKIRALPWSIGYGLLTSAVFGAWTFFGSVFLIYLNELGIPKGQMGLLLSIFPFCGLMAPLVAPVLAGIGAKRVALAAYTGRSLVGGLLVCLPFVIELGGRTTGVVFLAVIVLVFAVLRALGETAMLPWMQYYVPDRVRGKYGAVHNVCGTLASVAALGLAGYVVGRGTGLGRFMWLQAAACVAGVAGAMMLLKVPGGGPASGASEGRAHLADLREALCDRNFRNYLYGTAGVTLGSGMIAAFMPLMLMDKVGILPGTVIWLDNVALVGGMLTVYLWGWMADRYGSRTVLLPGITVVLLLSIAWSVILATGWIARIGVPHLVLLGALSGMASVALGMGSGRLFFTSVVPVERSVAYTGIYYAWLGLASGLAPILAGGILSAAMPSLHGGKGAFADSYTVLFVASLVPMALAWVFFYRTRPDAAIRTRDLIWRLAGQTVSFAQLGSWGLNLQRMLFFKLPQFRKPDNGD